MTPDKELCLICNDLEVEFMCDRCCTGICEGCSYLTPGGETVCAECITPEELAQSSVGDDA